MATAPPPTARRARRAGASAGAGSRQLILDTAARLFRHEGYAATSLRGLADGCGMKAGSLYYHFRSKEEIVSEVLALGVQQVFDSVREAIGRLPPEATLADTLRAGVEAHLRALLQAHDFTSANIRILGQVPEHVRQSHRALRRRYETYWVEVLSALRERGEIRADGDLRRGVFFLFGAMNWTTEWFNPRKSSLAVVAGELADLMAQGLQHAPPPGDGHRPPNPARLPR